MKLIFVLISFVFAGCITSSSVSRKTASLPEVRFINPQFSFSKDYFRPSSKQGASEARTAMSAEEFEARYKVLQSWGASYRQYNLWWSGVDSSGIASSAQPLNCPSGFQMVPANAQEKERLGFKRYRCVNVGYLQSFDNLFARDQAAGMQSGVVMWSSPEIYRYPGCVGFPFGGNYLKEGCVPRDDAMDDFEDYVNILASRYNGGALGKISYFIVWNENASPGWFDYSPVANGRDTMGPSVEKRIDKYAEMMKRAHAALERHQKGALLLVSTDMNWEPGHDKGHYGSRVLLEGLWKRLGTRYSWSVAVHPYLDVDGKIPSGRYTFANLEMVSQFQAQKLKQSGVADPSAYPQSLLIASEQGWPVSIKSPEVKAASRAHQARQMCLAHEKVMAMPEVVAVAHNYFHSNEEQENQGGRSVQGAFYGLIPFDVPNTLAGAERTPTGRAFQSTMNSATWGRDNGHYCCEVYGIGCKSARTQNVPSLEVAHAIQGHIDGLEQTPAGPVLKGWACARAVDASIAVHLYVGGPASRWGGGTLIAGYAAALANEDAVNAACFTAGGAHRFEIPLDAGLRSRFKGQKIFIHGISPLGKENAAISRSGDFIVP